MSEASTSGPEPLGHIGLPALRWLVAAIVVPFVPVLVLVGLIGPFADGTTAIEVILLVVVNPLAVLGAAWAMLDDAFFAQHRLRATAAAAFALVANASFAMAIANGTSAGDVEIPLIFAVPFVVFVPYGLWLYRLGHNR